MDIKRIYTHLTEDGFWEVGFAPVTTSPTRGHAIQTPATRTCWDSSGILAYEFLEASVANQHHGFST